MHEILADEEIEKSQIQKIEKTQLKKSKLTNEKIEIPQMNRKSKNFLEEQFLKL